MADTTEIKKDETVSETNNEEQPLLSQPQKPRKYNKKIPWFVFIVVIIIHRVKNFQKLYNIIEFTFFNNKNLIIYIYLTNNYY